MDFTFIIIGDGELILSCQTIEVTLYVISQLKVQCKEVKNRTSLLSINSVVNKTTSFGLLGGHHQVQQVLAIED